MRGVAKSIAMNLAGAIVAPLAMVANEVLPHPILAHAIAAPRRVVCSSSLGRISYYEDASATGLPVLLLHDVASPGSATALRALFEELRGERPLVVPDLLGHGFSERRRKPRFTRDDHVRFVEEVIEDISRRHGATIDIVAVGTTCEIAAEAVVRSPRHVRSIALIAPTGFEDMPRLVRRLKSLVSSDAMELRDEAVVARIYDALRVPTRFVHGADATAPRAEIDFLSRGHASFHRTEIRGGHAAPHVDRPDVTAEALRAFWRTLAVKPELRLIRGEKSERLDATRRRKWS